jgi:hypothetical protein
MLQKSIKQVILSIISNRLKLKCWKHFKTLMNYLTEVLRIRLSHESIAMKQKMQILRVDACIIAAFCYNQMSQSCGFFYVRPNVNELERELFHAKCWHVCPQL